MKSAAHSEAPSEVSSEAPHAPSETPPDAPLVDVPADDQSETRCPYCERPFPSEHLRTLHVGEAHAEECTDAEREDYEAARDDESDELFIFHVKVVFALSIVYTVFVLAYMVALTYGL